MSKEKEKSNELCAFDVGSLIFELSKRGYTCLKDYEYFELLSDDVDEEESSDDDGCRDTSGFPQYFYIERTKSLVNVIM